MGLFTAEGIWFHTTVESLTAFSPDVVSGIGLNRLIAEATAWARIPTHAGIWMLLAALAMTGTWQAVVASLATFLFLAVWGPILVRPGLARAARRLASPIFQGLMYVFVLSALAMSGHLDAMVVGLAGFVLFRWGIIDRLTAPLVARAPGVSTRLPAPDRTLRNLMIRYAFALGAYTDEVEAMEDTMVKLWNYRRK